MKETKLDYGSIPGMPLVEESNPLKVYCYNCGKYTVRTNSGCVDCNAVITKSDSTEPNQ